MGNTNDDILEAGDIVQGAIIFDPIDGQAVPAGSTVMAIYSLRIKSISRFGTMGSGGSVMELEAASGVDSVESVLTSLGVGTTQLGSGFNGDEGIALIETSAGTIGRPALKINHGGPTDFSTLFDSTGLTGADFETVLTAGFVDADDHHTIVALDVPASPFTSALIADLSDISTLAPGTGSSLADFVATYSIIDDAFGGGLTYLPIINPVSGAVGDIVITNGGISNTNSDTIGDGFHFNDDGDFQINAVPEPGSMAVWAVLMGIGGLAERTAVARSWLPN